LCSVPIPRILVPVYTLRMAAGATPPVSNDFICLVEDRPAGASKDLF
jgi:hypothetical protein